MVLARSSLPWEQRVLHDRLPKGSGVSRFTAFVRAAKARLLQDVNNLPVRSERNTIERQNMSFYHDEFAKQVLLVYSPTGTNELEFVSLSLTE